MRSHSTVSPETGLPPAINVTAVGGNVGPRLNGTLIPLIAIQRIIPLPNWQWGCRACPRIGEQWGIFIFTGLR